MGPSVCIRPVKRPHLRPKTRLLTWGIIMQQQFKKITKAQWEALGGFNNPNLGRRSSGKFGYRYFQYF